MTEPELDRMLDGDNTKITVDLRFQSSPFPNNYIEEYFDKYFAIEFLFYESKDLQLDYAANPTTDRQY